MASTEHAVREAAAVLAVAITAAKIEGYRVDWPSSADGLLAISISETAKVKPAAPDESKPAPAPSRFARAAKPSDPI